MCRSSEFVVPVLGQFTLKYATYSFDGGSCSSRPLSVTCKFIGVNIRDSACSCNYACRCGVSNVPFLFLNNVHQKNNFSTGRFQSDFLQKSILILTLNLSFGVPWFPIQCTMMLLGHKIEKWYILSIFAPLSLSYIIEVRDNSLFLSRPLWVIRIASNLDVAVLIHSIL